QQNPPDAVPPRSGGVFRRLRVADDEYPVCAGPAGTGGAALQPTMPKSPDLPPEGRLTGTSEGRRAPGPPNLPLSSRGRRVDDEKCRLGPPACVRLAPKWKSLPRAAAGQADSEAAGGHLSTVRPKFFPCFCSTRAVQYVC